MTSPAYLRSLALTYERAATNGTRTAAQREQAAEVARRLHEIATELDEFLSLSQGVAPATPSPPTRLTAGTDAAIHRLRAHQAAAPTPAELAEIRGIVGGHRRAR